MRARRQAGMHLMRAARARSARQRLRADFLNLLKRLAELAAFLLPVEKGGTARAGAPVAQGARRTPRHAHRSCADMQFAAFGQHVGLTKRRRLPT